MGQTDSKQLNRIKRDVDGIRGSIRQRKPNDNVKQDFKASLYQYRQEVIRLSKRSKKRNVDNTSRAIEETLRELESDQVDERNLDRHTVRANSFDRISLKSNSNDGKKTVRALKQAAEAIREEISMGRLTQEEVDKFQSELAAISRQLSQNGHKRDVEDAQKYVSMVMEELLSTPATKNSSNSEISENSQNLKSQTSSGPLQKIESELRFLQDDIKKAVGNKDTKQLKSLSKSVTTLMTDLQLVIVEPSSTLESRKNQIEKTLIRYNNKINRSLKEINRDSHINYLTELQEKEKREQILKELEQVTKALRALNPPDLLQTNNEQKFESIQKQLNAYKTKLNSVEEISRDIKAQKEEALTMIQSHEENLVVNRKLQQAEEAYNNFRPKMENFRQFDNLASYNDQLTYLRDLKKHVDKSLECEAQKNLSRKIEDSIGLLERRKKEHDDQNRRSVEIQGRRSMESLASHISVKSNVDSLADSYQQFESTFSASSHNPNEIVYVKNTLEQIKQSIDNKLKVINTLLHPPQTNSTIKVNAKLGNLPQSDPSTLDRKEHYPEIITINEEVRRMRSQIEKSIFKRDSQDYKSERSKLDGFKKQLKRLSFFGSDRTREFIDQILAQIDDTLTLLESKTSQVATPVVVNPERKSTSDDVLNDIMTVKSQVDVVGNRIKSLSTITKNEYRAIKDNLLEHQHHLKQIDMTTCPFNIYKARDDVLSQIALHINQLEFLEDQSQNATVEEKQFNDEFKKLREKVNRFTGTYRNVLYRSLEKDLKKCASRVDRVVKDKAVAEQMRKDIKNHLKILEQKSVKDTKYSENVQPQTSDYIKLLKTKNNFEEVRTELNRPTQKSRDELEFYHGRLSLIIIDLHNLNLKQEQYAEEKNKLLHEIDNYRASIHQQISLLNQPPQRIVTRQLPDFESSNKSGKPTTEAEELERIERTLQEVKPEIENFVGLENNQKFFELDELLIQSTLKLDKYKFDKTHPLHGKKLELLKKIQKYSDMLDDRVKQSEEMEEIEKEANEFEMKIDLFSGYYKDQEYNVLDEQLIDFRVRVERFVVTDQLILRKNNIVRRIGECMRKLNGAPRIEGSLV